jgi:hypothetical protein
MLDTGAGSSNLTYLPLDKILEDSARRSGGSPVGTTPGMFTEPSPSASSNQPASRSRDFSRTGRVR